MLIWHSHNDGSVFWIYCQNLKLIKFVKYSDKEKYLKTGQKKSLTYKGKAVRLAGDFSTEIWQARREWPDIFKVLKGKNMQPGKALQWYDVMLSGSSALYSQRNRKVCFYLLF